MTIRLIAANIIIAGIFTNCLSPLQAMQRNALAGPIGETVFLKKLHFGDPQAWKSIQSLGVNQFKELINKMDEKEINILPPEMRDQQFVQRLLDGGKKELRQVEQLCLQQVKKVYDNMPEYLHNQFQLGSEKIWAQHKNKIEGCACATAYSMLVLATLFFVKARSDSRSQFELLENQVPIVAATQISTAYSFYLSFLTENILLTTLPLVLSFFVTLLILYFVHPEETTKRILYSLVSVSCSVLLHFAVLVRFGEVIVAYQKKQSRFPREYKSAFDQLMRAIENVLKNKIFEERQYKVFSLLKSGNKTDTVFSFNLQ